VEIKKGTLQIAKALMFLHQQAKMVHLNITPDAILVNAKVPPLFLLLSRG
jgi:SCY1-like protein 2